MGQGEVTRPMRGRVLVKVTSQETDSIIVGATEKVRRVVAVGAGVDSVEVGDEIPHEVGSPSTKVVTPEWGTVYSVSVNDIQAVLRDHT